MKMRAFKRLLGPSGFTMLEALITMAVLTIGILGVGGLAIATIDGNEAANNLTTATIVGQDRMEVLKADVWDNFPLYAETDTAVTVSGRQFLRTTTVTVDAPDLWTATVAVTVTWNGGVNGVTLNSVVGRDWKDP